MIVHAVLVVCAQPDAVELSVEQLRNDGFARKGGALWRVSSDITSCYYN